MSRVEGISNKMKSLDYAQASLRPGSDPGASLLYPSLFREESSRGQSSDLPATRGVPHHILPEAAAESALLEDKAADVVQIGYKEAERKGFQDGRSSALESYKNDISENFASVVKAIGQVVNFRSELERRIQPQIVTLSVRIAQKILSSRVEIDNLSLAATVRLCLESSQVESSMTLKVSPTDHLSWLSLFGSDGKRQGTVLIEIDPTLKSGMCNIETVFGKVDLSAEAQLQEIGSRFKRLLGEEQAGIAQVAFT